MAPLPALAPVPGDRQPRPKALSVEGRLRAPAALLLHVCIAPQSTQASLIMLLFAVLGPSVFMEERCPPGISCVDVWPFHDE